MGRSIKLMTNRKSETKPAPTPKAIHLVYSKRLRYPSSFLDLLEIDTILLLYLVLDPSLQNRNTQLKRRSLGARQPSFALWTAFTVRNIASSLQPESCLHPTTPQSHPDELWSLTSIRVCGSSHFIPAVPSTTSQRSVSRHHYLTITTAQHAVVEASFGPHLRPRIASIYTLPRRASGTRCRLNLDSACTTPAQKPFRIGRTSSPSPE